MTEKSSLLRLALPLLLLCGCQPSGQGAAGDAAAASDCSLAAWGSTLELGLRRDEESARRLDAMRFDNRCVPEIRKLAEVLHDDRIPERKMQPEKPAKVRFRDPDLRVLKLPKQPSVQVILELSIDATGKVTRADFIERHPDDKVNDLFLETAKNWLFRPAREGDAYRESKLPLSATIHVR